MKVFLFLLLVGWQWTAAQSKNQPHVVLISFDGFRNDYVSRFDSPHFKEFIKKGSSAEGLIPSFPSKTFPNHYTIVTGLYPGRHGLVDNYFYDDSLNIQYSMRDQATVTDPVFYGGTPLWQLAQQQGLRSASYFWVGSEAPVKGEYPTFYTSYDQSVSDVSRIDTVIQWLKLPDQQRPQFTTLYFSLVDTEGHNTGTDSDQLRKTVLKADSLLGYLMTQIKRIKLSVNIILVSDHGMLQLNQKESTYVILSQLYDLSNTSVRTVNGGTQAHIYTQKVDSVYTALKALERNFVVYRKDNFPERWHYNHHRTGNILLVANPGYHFLNTSRNFGNVRYPVFGVHGYDPHEVKEMQGIFYAMGPDIKKGKQLPAFENIHIYPFIARILDLQTPPVDGQIRVLESLYKK